MASLRRSPSGRLFICFRFAGQQYQRTLMTSDPARAKAMKGRIEDRIFRITSGDRRLPHGVDPGDFIVRGKAALRRAETNTPVPVAKSLSLAALIEKYLADQFTKAKSSIGTERTHLNNLKKVLGSVADRPCTEITLTHLTSFLQQRRKTRRANTVKKERMTIRHLFAWACGQGHLFANPAADLIKIKGSGDRKKKFRTTAMIEAIAQRGGLSSEELAALWDCLYLEPWEIAGILRLVRERGTEDFSHLLHVLPAYTGMRRGEILHLQWQDVDLETGIITARSRKQSSQDEETSRDIDVHAELLPELMEWRERRPKGQFVISRLNVLTPLEPNDANRAFWQPLRGTTWQLDGKRNWFKIGFHTYRHSFASNLAALGVDQRYIDRWMGHQTEAMRKRYQHLFPNKRREAIESFSFGISSLAAIAGDVA
jgi:integrase